MSDNILTLDQYKIKSKKEPSNIYNQKSRNSSLLNKIISEKSSLNITIPDKSLNICLDISSVKRIFLMNQLDYEDYINIFFDKDELNINSEGHSLNESMTISTNRKTEKDFNEEITEEGDEITIKEDDSLNDEKNKKDITLTIKKRNEIFDPNSPLLNNKICNTFSSIDKAPKKYLSLIICGNKAIISLDYLKCIYPTIFCCGIFNLLYFINNLIKIGKHLNIIYHYFLYLPIAILLISTGIYGYKKIKKNIYNDEFVMVLNNLCAILPIFSFALTLIYKEVFENKNIFLNFIINFISCFFSFSCIIILKEAERAKNSEKNILQS
jgi:hypothetical protein